MPFFKLDNIGERAKRRGIDFCLREGCVDTIKLKIKRDLIYRFRSLSTTVFSKELTGAKILTKYLYKLTVIKAEK